VVGTETAYGLDNSEVVVRVPVGVKNFLFSKSSRLALWSTQPPIQWVPGALSQGYSGRGVKLTIHLQLV
jgi:hypothetical protein